MFFLVLNKQDKCLRHFQCWIIGSESLLSYTPSTGSLDIGYSYLFDLSILIFFWISALLLTLTLAQSDHWLDKEDLVSVLELLVSNVWNRIRDNIFKNCVDSRPLSASSTNSKLSFLFATSLYCYLYNEELPEAI